MASITIIGCSWACGEWGVADTAQGYRVLHPGTEQYLREAGHRVTQLAQGGSSNRHQVDLLLASPGRDHTIWFLTDPLGDITETGIARTLPEYLAQRDLLLRRQFDRVHRLPILLCGGVCSVPAWVHTEYPNITTVCPDLRCWLLPDREPCETLCRGWQYPACDPALLAHWEQDERVLALHRSRAQHQLDQGEHRWFWPDGRHPNRAAHLRLTRERILPRLNPAR
jgi:hypothetical protein